MPIERLDLSTDRLSLQPITSEHADGVFAATLASRPELLPWMPWAKEPTPEGTRAGMAKSAREWLDGSRFHFAVTARDTGAVLGVAGLNLTGDGSAELSYWIRSDHAGRGLTTEACTELIAWATRTIGVTRFTLWAGRENRASRRVAVKLGFTHIGPLDWEPDGGLGTFAAEKYELIASPLRGEVGRLA